jgi:AcrR family transcriptional regulator
MTENTNNDLGLASSEASKISGARLPRKRQSREERAGEVREAIFHAAAEVVGNYGYAEASISRITEAAGLAQGTFYLYFKSRQVLFDELLPHVGMDMLNFISDRVRGAKDVLELEERGFRSFFEYLQHNPGFFRILNEAEVAAPIAHRKHFKLLTDHYVESLDRGITAGQISNFESSELETLAYVFMASRSYLYMRYVKDATDIKTLPEEVIQTYMKLVRGGLR